MRETGLVLDFCKAICSDFFVYALQKSSVTAKNEPPARFLYAASSPVYLICRPKYRKHPVGVFCILVRETGLEPVRCNPHAPQTCASASSATLAYICRLRKRRILLYIFFLICQVFFQKKYEHTVKNAICLTNTYFSDIL